MSIKEWPAEDYAIGSYIQATIAEKYLSRLQINPKDKVLDIGCGNGAFTKKILEKVPEGSVLGIDPSENMLHLAEEVKNEYTNFSVKKADVLTMSFNELFDYVVSFWCLQWAPDVHKSFSHIYDALKPGGKILTLFPAGDDPFINGYYALKKSGQFRSLDQFKPPVEYENFENLSQKLSDIPFKNLNVELCNDSITLPSLDIFKKFVNGLAFYPGQISDDEVKQINETLVNDFDKKCREKYQGEYRFNICVYLITGSK